MDANRERYGKASNPNRLGRPPGSGGRYLLTGLLKCEICAVIETAWKRVEARGAAGIDDRSDRQSRDRLAWVREELRNLGEAIATRGTSVTLLDSLDQREREQRALTEKIAAHELVKGGGLRAHKAAMAHLREAMADWRGLLGKRGVATRNALKQLIVNRLAMEPTEDEHGRGYRFSGTTTIDAVIAGILPSNLASPGGNPTSYLEGPLAA
jgi:hypothetical protein